MIRFLPTLLVACLVLAGEAAEPKWISLFNGKNLEGWTVLGTAKWQAENGILSGGQDGDPKRSGLICTQQVFQDFILELEFKIDEHGKYNSGVYLRQEAGTRRQSGYQLNIGRGAAGEYIGLHRKEWLDKGDEQDTIRKPKQWNHLRIRAEGAHIQAWLNKTQIVDYTDPAPDPKLLAPGGIGLQTYGAEGHAGWVKFRGIRIRKLP